MPQKLIPANAALPHPFQPMCSSIVVPAGMKLLLFFSCTRAHSKRKLSRMGNERKTTSFPFRIHLLREKREIESQPVIGKQSRKHLAICRYFRIEEKTVPRKSKNSSDCWLDWLSVSVTGEAILCMEQIHTQHFHPFLTHFFPLFGAMRAHFAGSQLFQNASCWCSLFAAKRPNVQFNFHSLTWRNWDVRTTTLNGHQQRMQQRSRVDWNRVVFYMWHCRRLRAQRRKKIVRMRLAFGRNCRFDE